jgi:hypothetical protein
VVMNLARTGGGQAMFSPPISVSAGGAQHFRCDFSPQGWRMLEVSMIGLGFLIAVGPALTLLALGALIYWALTHGPPGRRGGQRQ